MNAEVTHTIILACLYIAVADILTLNTNRYKSPGWKKSIVKHKPNSWCKHMFISLILESKW